MYNLGMSEWGVPRRELNAIGNLGDFLHYNFRGKKTAYIYPKKTKEYYQRRLFVVRVVSSVQHTALILAIDRVPVSNGAPVLATRYHLTLHDSCRHLEMHCVPPNYIKI